MFDKCKFSILLAFHIAFKISTKKKGLSSEELSEEYELRQQNPEMNLKQYNDDFPRLLDKELALFFVCYLCILIVKVNEKVGHPFYHHSY